MELIKIIFNQHPIWVKINSRLQTVLDNQVLPKVFAIAVNGKFVSKLDYPHYTLQQDDQIAMLTPMQGG